MSSLQPLIDLIDGVLVEHADQPTAEQAQAVAETLVERLRLEQQAIIEDQVARMQTNLSLRSDWNVPG